MNRCRSVALVALALLVSTSGCSFGERVDATEVSVAVEEPVVLRIGHTSSLVSDPLAVQPLDSASVILADALTDGLTDLAADGSVVPAVAASWESADAVVWRFTLGNRTWPDTQPITSTDVAASLGRVLASAGSSLHGARLASAIADGGVATDGDRVVVVTAREPNYELPAMLAAVPYGVLRASELEAAGVAGGASAEGGAGLDLVGGGWASSGPFTVGVVTRQAPLISLKRSSFGGERAEIPVVAGTAVAPTTLEFVGYSSVGMVLDAFERDEVDLAQLDADATPTAGVEVVEVEGAVIYSAIGSQRSLADRAVRAGVVAAVVGDAGRPMQGIVPGGVLECGSCVVAGAGGPAGAGAGAGEAEVRLVVGPGGSLGRGGTAVADRLSSVGVNVERTDLAKEAVGAALDGTADVTVFVVPGLVATPDVVLGSLFGSTGKENLSGYSSRDFDEAFAAARAVPDPTARRDAYGALLQRVAEAAPGVPLESVSTRWAVGGRVSGVTPRAGRLLHLDVLSVTP